jgi:beta-glucosidase
MGIVEKKYCPEKVRRLLHTAARFGWLDRDQTDLSVPRYNEQSREVALQAAIEGMVLLKNDGGLLPLKKQPAPTIAVIGPDAYPAVPVGGGSAAVRPFASVSFLEGLSNNLGEGTRVLYARGIPTIAEMAEQSKFSVNETGGGPGLRAEYFANADLQGAPTVSLTESVVNVGGQLPAWPADARSARWSGYYVPPAAGPQEVFVQTSGERGPTFRLTIDDKVVLEKTTGMNTALAYMAMLTLDARPHKVVLEERDSAPGGGRRLRLGLMPRGSMVESDAKTIAAKADDGQPCVAYMGPGGAGHSIYQHHPMIRQDQRLTLV